MSFHSIAKYVRLGIRQRILLKKYCFIANQSHAQLFCAGPSYPTVGEKLKNIKQQLKQGDIEEYELHAEYLLAKILNVKRVSDVIGYIHSFNKLMHVS